MILTKKMISMVFSSILTISTMFNGFSTSTVDIKTFAETNYPIQEFKIGISDTNRNVNISGFSDDSTLNSWTSNGEQNEKWYLNYISDGLYEIVNSKTQKIITNNNNICTISTDIDGTNQRWKIVGVDKDFNGEYLYYKIVSNQDDSLAMTFNPNGNTITLQEYQGNDYQKFKLNCDGLEGFAGNCVVSEGEKASTIGGLLGETVFVDTLDELKNALVEDKPLTIVVTKSIDCSAENYDWRIEDNKTIVGAYGSGQLKDCKLRTNDYFGVEEPSDNIIIRNMNIQIETNPKMMAISIYSSKNIWIDHCTFNCTFTKEYDEVGKFIWINTLYDGKDLERSPDFITISYNSFNNRFWGVAFGTQNGSTNENRASVMYNIFNSVVQRCPQMGNGSLHVYNNYYVRETSSINNDGMAQIKCGDGGKVYSISNRFDNFLKESSGYWDNEITIDNGATFIDYNSYTNKTENGGGIPKLLSISGSYNKTTWKPSESYGYEVISAYDDTNGIDIKDFCIKYSGCFKNYNDIQYITNSDVSNYVIEKVSAPFLKSISVTQDTQTNETTTVESTVIGEVMNEDFLYMFKNVNSGQYLEVEGGVATNGTNVQQWGANGSYNHNTWNLKCVEDGYYKIYSQLLDGKTYLLDVTNGLSSNGTNIGIYEDTKSDAQLFKFIKNDDETYTILTKVSNDSSCVEVQGNSTSSGANVQEFALNGENCQKWILETVLPVEATSITAEPSATTESNEFTTNSTDTNVLGDINNDNNISYLDLMILKKYILNINENLYLEVADLNKDNSIDILDCIMLKDIILHT